MGKCWSLFAVRTEILNTVLMNLFFYFSSCWLVVSIYPKGFATGHLDTGFRGFPLTLSKCWDGSQISTCFLRSPPGLNSSQSLPPPLLWKPPNYWLYKTAIALLIMTLKMPLFLPPVSIVTTLTCAPCYQKGDRREFENLLLKLCPFFPWLQSFKLELINTEN